jgi:hypothetical protein
MLKQSTVDFYWDYLVIPTSSLQAQHQREELTPKTDKQEFIVRGNALNLRASGNLHKDQARYKRNLTSISGEKEDLKEGDEAYAKVERIETGRNHKLESLINYRTVQGSGECRSYLPIADR